MNRRTLLTALAALPFVGALFSEKVEAFYDPNHADWFRGKDGVPLTSMEHPNGAFRTYALAGETVTCENGHPICDFADHVCVGDQFRDKDLENWRQDKPEIGSPIPRCAVCGARFALPGNLFHIGNEWRDPNELIATYGMPED